MPKKKLDSIKNGAYKVDPSKEREGYINAREVNSKTIKQAVQVIERKQIKKGLSVKGIGKTEIHNEGEVDKREGSLSSHKVLIAYSTSAILSEAVDKPESHLTSFEKMDIVTSGISKKGLEQFKTKTAIDYDRLAKMLSTTKVTLISKKGEEKFSASLSEKILSVADVYSYGYEVFEDEERFNSWMLSPIRALGGKAPYEIMDNQFGREEVKNIIGRIAYGVYS